MQKLAMGTLGLLSCILAMTLVSQAEWPYKNKEEALDPYLMGGAMYRTENGIVPDGLYRMGRQTKPLKIRHVKRRTWESNINALKDNTIPQSAKAEVK